MVDIGNMFGAAGVTTFFGLPAARPGEGRPGAAILGVPAATPYKDAGAYCAEAPQAMRRALAGYAGAAGHMDFDLGRPVFGDGSQRFVDCGDLDWDKVDFAANRERVRAVVRDILGSGAVPVVLGGDDSIPIPVLQAYEGRGPLTILQIDAHIDWRDEVGGERWGLSSTMRRTSEMAHVDRMIQVGQRGVGSARPSDHQDALNAGVHFLSARELHRRGIEAVLELIPRGASVFVNLDVDAFDPSLMPAVIGPAPGGLSYTQVIEMLHGVAARARIAGFSIVELFASRDRDGISALTAGRVVCNVLGLIAAP